MTDTTNAGGGAAAAGGFDFQAVLGTIAYVHVLRGTPVAWIRDWTASPPTAVAFETGGPGDDIRLELADGTKVEVQAKKRLTASSRFWSALYALCQGIASNRCDYAILAVGPLSSKPVTDDYARALPRLGTGSPAPPTRAQTELARRLDDEGHDMGVCSRLRIKTISALPEIADAVNGARTELAHLCADRRQEPSAWHALYRDAMAATANRERRTLPDLLSVLHASNVDVSKTSNDSPAEVAHAIQEWTLSRTEHFQVLGMPRLLPTDEAWLPLRAFVRDSRSRDHSSVEEALAAYRAIGDESTRTLDQVDARTIGTFRNLCVIVGGPGTGKSLLLDVLARDFTKDSHVSLRVSLRDLATRVASTGCTVEEGVLALGLGNSGVHPPQLRSAALQEPVILCDGLDECGAQQSTIASALRELAASHPSYRIIVTTRPFGYITSELAAWRHYEISALVENKVPKYLEILCRSALEPNNVRLDSLRRRITAYLAKSNVTGTLARAPLLLGFAASLFLRSEQPTRSKSELYARIFRMIDQTPVPSGAASAVPARAVRDSVLNQLGWLSVTSPLCPAGEIETRCADRLIAMGVQPIQAVTEVEKSIEYWERVGLVERLRHADVELIAFVHKTCGEFAAARHLAEIGTDSAREIIRTELANPDSLEILDFATQTPLATTMAEMLIAEFEAHDPNPAILDRLFPIIARPETSLSPTDRTSFLERVFELATSEDRRRAYRAGARLARSDLSRFPEAAPMAERLLQASAEWSRLIGWAVLAQRFPDRLDLDRLDEVLHHFVTRSRDDDFFVFEKRTVFGAMRDRAVFEEFLIGASRRLLSAGDTARQVRTISAVRGIQNELTARFVSRFDPLLEEFGRADAVERHPSRWRRFFDPSFPFIPRDWDDQTASVLNDVVSAAFLRHSSRAPPGTGLKFLSAFINMAGVLKAVAGDFYVWRSATSPLTDVHAALQDAAYVFGLSTERLAGEARRAIELVGALGDQDGRKSPLDLFPDIDPPEIDWTRARGMGTDARLLERLVHHPSTWMSLLAAHLLDEQLSLSERPSVCERILASGSGDALHWGAALALELPEAEGCQLILRRLERPSAEGLYQLFGLLADELPALDSAHRPALENGLFNCGSMAAAAAARWCRAAGSPNDDWPRPLLRRALRHWLEHEDDPGPIYHPPGSPRESLLHALCDIGDSDPAMLADLSADGRHDVAGAALKCLVRHAVQSTEGRAELVAMVVGRRFTPELCDQLIDKDIPFDGDQLAAMAAMRNDPDPQFRITALRRVFTHPCMDRGAAAAAAKTMTDDHDANVRDAAYRFLDSSPEPA